MPAIFILILVYGGSLISAMASAAPVGGDTIDLRSLGSDLYGKPDEVITAQRVANFSGAPDEGNPEELGTYLEGDMLDPRPLDLMRSGLPSESLRWPNATVPFHIDGNFTDDQLDILAYTFGEYHRRTCIRFVPHVDEPDYVSFDNGDSGCWSSVGRIGGEQTVNLQTPACLKRAGTVIHEIMHVLGFVHEQNREERDDYVSINEENVRADYLKNFKKANDTVSFGVGYDYGSIMHYSRTAFSSNGQSTIKRLKKRRNKARMGQRDDFSDMDLKKINRMYNCTAEKQLLSPEIEETILDETKEDSKEDLKDATEGRTKNV